MVILPWMVKFVKKNWKKIMVVIVSLIVFCNVLVIGIKLYIWGYIPVKVIGGIETYEIQNSAGEYCVDTKEEFLERLETWREKGWSLEDIGTVREELQQYDGDDILIIWSCEPVKYLCYYRDDPHERVYGSYVYQEREQRTKIYVYITDYQDKIYQSQFWG